MHAVCSKKVISLTLLSLTSDHVMHHVCEEMVHQGKTLYHGGSTKRGRTINFADSGNLIISGIWIMGKVNTENRATKNSL